MSDSVADCLVRGVRSHVRHSTLTSGWVVAPGIFLGVLDDDIGANLGKSYGRLGCSDTSFCESQRFARVQLADRRLRTLVGHEFGKKVVG
jgi:hypothetical protein